MDWQKSILQKDKTYYLKYQELQGIFTTNNHIFDNAIQINIKFTFIVCEYILHIYPLIQFDIKSRNITKILWMSFCLKFIQDISKKGIQSQYIIQKIKKSELKQKLFHENYCSDGDESVANWCVTLIDQVEDKKKLKKKELY